MVEALEAGVLQGRGISLENARAVLLICLQRSRNPKDV